MKKLFYLFALAAAVLSGCIKSKDRYLPNDQSGDGAVKFFSWINPQTRATDTAWQAGDEIGIYMVSANGTVADNSRARNMQYVTTAGDGVFTGKIQSMYFPIGTAVDFVAYYPYNSAVADCKYPIDLSDQSVPAAIDLMVSNNAKGYSTGVPSLSFKHRLTKVVFNVSDTNGASLEGMTTSIFGPDTEGTYNISTDKIEFSQANPTTAFDAYLRSASGSTAVVEAIIMPLGGNVSYDVTFRLADGSTVMLTIKTKNYEEGKKYSYNVTTDDRKAEVVRGGATITDWTAVADGDYQGERTPPGFVYCPAGEVAIEMSGGKVIWAGSNLDDYQVFAVSESLKGCAFQWGYDNALALQETPTPTGWHSVVSGLTQWNPCPIGWRLPTAQEFKDLIGAASMSSSINPGTSNNAYTTTSWTTGSDIYVRGLKVVPKSDTSKALYFANAGGYGSAGATEGYNTVGNYWSSTQGSAASNAYAITFDQYNQAANLSDITKLKGCSVRCVR